MASPDPSAFARMTGETRWRTGAREASLVHRFYDGPPDFDPCGAQGDPIGARLMFDIGDGPLLGGVDGLAQRWRGLGRGFCNPPYGRGVIDAWVLKARREYTDRPLPRAADTRLMQMVSDEMLLLVPANTETNWWHLHCLAADAVCEVKGRYQFDPPPGQTREEQRSTVANAWVYWGERPDHFCASFRDEGDARITRAGWSRFQLAAPAWRVAAATEALLGLKLLP